MVLPILSYASEVWAVDKKVGESAEQLHWQFLKHVLGVRGSTATLLVLAEFGRYPLRFHWWQQILRYPYKSTLNEAFIIRQIVIAVVVSICLIMNASFNVLL